MTRFVFQGSGHTTSGSGIKAAACAGAVLLLAGAGSAGALAANVSAAITDLLYWIAGVFGTAALVAAAVFVWWLRGRAEREARAADAIAEQKRVREAEIEDRQARRAITAARAQADAWSPLIAAVVAGMQQPQPWPQRQPAPVIIPPEHEELPR